MDFQHLGISLMISYFRYKFIITHLIKFPTVFKISPSITKITQAFWQLDHGDFGVSINVYNFLSVFF